MSRLTGNERAIVVTALKHAAPYIRIFKRKVFVIKAGGEAFLSAATTRSIVEQVSILHEVGIRVVLVHGGGPQSTQLAKEREFRFSSLTVVVSPMRARSKYPLPF